MAKEARPGQENRLSLCRLCRLVVFVTPALAFVVHPMSAENVYFLSMGEGRVFVCIVCFVAQSTSTSSEARE